MADTPSTHPDHDTILVAALAAGDLADLARADAEALVAGCPDCAALHDDLVAIASATRALPAPARTRDFRLTPEQAAALRPSGVRRLLAAFGSPRLAVTRPLAVTFTTLGIAGLLLTAIPAGGPLALSGSERQAAQVPSAGDGLGGATASAPVPAFGAGSPAPLPGGGDTAGEPAAGSAAPEAVASDAANGSPKDAADRAQDELAGQPSLPWLGLLSGAFLVVGLGLFALRLAARRVGAG